MPASAPPSRWARTRARAVTGPDQSASAAPPGRPIRRPGSRSGTNRTAGRDSGLRAPPEVAVLGRLQPQLGLQRCAVLDWTTWRSPGPRRQVVLARTRPPWCPCSLVPRVLHPPPASPRAPENGLPSPCDTLPPHAPPAYLLKTQGRQVPRSNCKPPKQGQGLGLCRHSHPTVVRACFIESMYIDQKRPGLMPDHADPSASLQPQDAWGCSLFLAGPHTSHVYRTLHFHCFYLWA